LLQQRGLCKRSSLFVISLRHILSKLCGFLRKHIAVAVVKTAGFSVKKLGYDADMLYHANVELAEEARILEAAGIDEITLMDSAGCMFPDQVSASVEAVKRAVKIPIGFHCHADMGMCSANAVAAYRSGADILDCGLLGMARSAGNMPTELATALMQREGECRELDFYGLLHYLDQELNTVFRVQKLKNRQNPLMQD
jgi:4-hydroxy 2-oxovalerate aldolase